jgi:hypothetical protein
MALREIAEGLVDRDILDAKNAAPESTTEIGDEEIREETE